MVSIRLVSSGPVSSMTCLPTGPNFGSSGSVDTSSVALHFSTPRGRANSWSLRELVGVRVVELLGLLFGVEVVQVAEELVEAVHGRQVLVLVAEVVLAELAGGVARAA